MVLHIRLALSSFLPAQTFRLIGTGPNSLFAAWACNTKCIYRLSSPEGIIGAIEEHVIDHVTNLSHPHASNDSVTLLLRCLDL